MKQIFNSFIDSLDGLLVAFVVLFATIKIILDPSSRAFKAAIASYVVGVPVGILSALIAQEWGLGNATSIGLGCVTCLTAERLIIFIMGFEFEHILKKLIDKRFK